MSSAKKNYTAEQIIRILAEADASDEPIKDFARRHGVTEWTFYRWRKKYGSMSVPDATRLKDLEREETLRMIRKLCEQHGDDKWPDNLHLGDALEKHLAPYLDDDEEGDEEQ